MMSESTPPIGSYDVLHVDDDPDFRELLETFLQRESDSLTICSAPDAGSCLDYLSGNSVHCIVSDYDMPGKDGIGLLEKIREDHPDLPFILFTGKGSEEVASQAISAGVTDYIQKNGPETYSLLGNRIEQAVEKYHTEQELKEIRQRYKLVGRVATDGFYEKDWETKNVVRSHGYTTNFGYEPDEIGDDEEWWRKRVHPDDRDRVLDIVEETLESGERKFTETYRFRMADGSYGDIRDRGIIVCDDGGNPDRVVGTLTDITEQKRRQRKLQREVERLDEFAGLVSHDLRNPLRSIQMRLELIQEECDCEHLEKAIETADYMNALITDILTFARQGSSIDEREPIDLAQLVRECWHSVQTDGVKLELQADGTVEGDRTRLSRIFQNLIRNSIEHGGEGVTIEIGDFEDGFYYEDDGEGIPEGISEDIFEVGFTTNEDGTGFGLSIVREIIDVHGWSIDVTQASDGGARFEISDIGEVLNN